MANGKHYCNSSPLCYLNPSSVSFIGFTTHFVPVVFRQISGAGTKKKKRMEERKCFKLWLHWLQTEMNLKELCYWADLQRLFTGLKTLFARAVTTVISSISPPLHFQTFPFSETGSLMLLWPYWACANTAQGNSTKRQHLLWVNPTERTETRLHFFLICLVICYILSWFCYVAG